MRPSIRLALLCSIALLMTTRAALAQTPVYGYEVLNRYPHDTSAFTEGLVYSGGALYESTGLYGSSTLRQVDLRTGTVLRSVSLASQYFGEGATLFQGKIFQLTWQSQTAFVYDASTFAPLGQFFYTGEGWGLTHDDRYLIMSDGTNQIRFRDPATFQTIRTISVHDQQGAPLTNINELEYINGEIYANVWLTDTVARIDPASGLIVAWINFAGLLPAGTSADVLNGIAYDSTTGHLLVTGKLWPYLFEVRLTNPAASPDGTMVPTTASQIVDNNGAVWTISGFAILRNGTSAAGGYGTKIYWKNSTIYVYGTDNNWWQWTGTGWTNVGTTQPGGSGGGGGGGTGNPSPDGTMVPTSASQIVDNNGAVWTISGFAILRNGTSAAGGYGTKIYWTNSTIYVYGTDNNWWQWTGTGWTNVGTTQPGGSGGGGGGGTGTPSADGTMVPTTASQIVDDSGAVWTISSNIILRNGTSAAGGYGTKIYWKNSTIYVYGTDGNWWQWTGTGWTNVGTTQPGSSGGGGGGGTGSPSPDGTMVPTTASQIVDNSGAVWTISSNMILRNGTSAAGGYGTKIYWKNGTIYVYGTDNNWWQWTGSGWIKVASPI